MPQFASDSNGTIARFRQAALIGENWRQSTNAISKGTAFVPGASSGTEQRLKELSINHAAPLSRSETYVEAVQTASLHFLSGMLSTEGRMAKLNGRVGAEIYVEVGRKAAQLAVLEAIVEVE